MTVAKAERINRMSHAETKAYHRYSLLDLISAKRHKLLYEVTMDDLAAELPGDRKKVHRLSLKREYPSSEAAEIRVR